MVLKKKKAIVLPVEPKPKKKKAKVQQAPEREEPKPTKVVGKKVKRSEKLSGPVCSDLPRKAAIGSIAKPLLSPKIKRVVSDSLSVTAEVSDTPSGIKVKSAGMIFKAPLPQSPVTKYKGSSMKKYLTVSELEAQEGSPAIWALNGSAGSEVGQAGDVHVGIPKINGTKVDALYLPQTFLPFCLTEQIPRNQLLASSEFRNSVNTNLLVLITEEYAQTILQEDGVEEERDRLMQLKRQVREATAARSITQSGAEIVNTAELEDNTETKVTSARGDELDPGFVMFADNLTMKTDVEAANAIRSRGRKTVSEVKYLLKVLHDKPKTKALLESALANKG